MPTDHIAYKLIGEGSLPVARDRSWRVLGIDLGTTNSTIAEVVWHPADAPSVRARCLEVDQSTEQGLYTHVLVPSVVALANGQVLIGEGAKRARSHAGERGLRQNQNLFYECKNDIGLRRTYHKAPEGFRTATEIGAQVLRFLRAAALRDDDTLPDRLVVTVPASFQAAQRQETVRAAAIAELDIGAGDLLDEPIAAFIDFLITHGADMFRDVTGRRRLVVFDFGGGTCDVAVVEVEFLDRAGPPRISPLSVSRYHRLGGGDIDAAIVHEVLLKQLQEQNGLGTFDLSFEDKKLHVEPALLGIAEALKIGLSSEIRRLNSFGQYERADKDQIVKTQSGLHRLRVGGRDLQLTSPCLTAAQFEAVLRPFLDADLLYAVESEYRQTCSIFAPLSDALDRSGVERDGIDFCLLVGGSSLIPHVERAVGSYFRRSQMLTYPDAIDLQMAVARGAAYQAFSLAMTGRGVFQPVAHDDISIRTSSGLVKLVPRGARLPIRPEQPLLDRAVLSVPDTTLLESIPLRVELVAGEGDRERVVFSGIWDIPGPVNKGDALLLARAFDENQVLSLELRLADDQNVPPFTFSIENPLTHVSNPLRERLQIDEREEALRTQAVPRERIPVALTELADSYLELGHREKTLEYLKRALKAKGRPDAGILNKMGLVCGELGDREREERLFREASAASRWSGPLFNLALSQLNRGMYDQASATADEVLSRSRTGPCLVLAAEIAQKRGLSDDAARLLREARTRFNGPPLDLADWELTWAATMARLLHDAELMRLYETERRRRRRGDLAAGAEGRLPDLRGGLITT